MNPRGQPCWRRMAPFYCWASECPPNKRFARMRARRRAGGYRAACAELRAAAVSRSPSVFSCARARDSFRERARGVGEGRGVAEDGWRGTRGRRREQPRALPRARRARRGRRPPPTRPSERVTSPHYPPLAPRAWRPARAAMAAAGDGARRLSGGGGVSKCAVRLEQQRVVARPPPSARSPPTLRCVPHRIAATEAVAGAATASRGFEAYMRVSSMTNLFPVDGDRGLARPRARP